MTSAKCAALALLFSMYLQWRTVCVTGAEYSPFCPPTKDGVLGLCNEDCEEDSDCMNGTLCCPNNCGSQSCTEIDIPVMTQTTESPDATTNATTAQPISSTNNTTDFPIDTTNNKTTIQRISSKNKTKDFPIDTTNNKTTIKCISSKNKTTEFPEDTKNETTIQPISRTHHDLGN